MHENIQKMLNEFKEHHLRTSREIKKVFLHYIRLLYIQIMDLLCQSGAYFTISNLTARNEF